MCNLVLEIPHHGLVLGLKPSIGLLPSPSTHTRAQSHRSPHSVRGKLQPHCLSVTTLSNFSLSTFGLSDKVMISGKIIDLLTFWEFCRQGCTERSHQHVVLRTLRLHSNPFCQVHFCHLYSKYQAHNFLLLYNALESDWSLVIWLHNWSAGIGSLRSVCDDLSHMVRWP